MTQSNHVSSPPKGYNTITPYLIVDNGKKALEFYKQVFGAEVVMCMDRPGEKIGHAELKIGDSKIMLADEYTEEDIRSPHAYKGTPVFIHAYVPNVDETVEKAVAAGATILRPIENMFYGDRNGTIEDPFGHRWSIATHVEDVSMDELKKRSKEFAASSSN